MAKQQQTTRHDALKRLFTFFLFFYLSSLYKNDTNSHSFQPTGHRETPTLLILLRASVEQGRRLNMILRRKAQSGNSCSSAGRVTSQIILSFLALAASPVSAASNARSNDEALVPLPPSSLFVPTPEPPPPAEHTFVSPYQRTPPTIVLTYFIDATACLPSWYLSAPETTPKKGCYS